MDNKVKGTYYLNKHPRLDGQPVDVTSTFTEPLHKTQERKEYSHLIQDEMAKIQKMAFVQKNSYLTNKINRLRKPKTDAEAYELTILIEALKHLHLEPELTLLLKHTPRRK